MVKIKVENGYAHLLYFSTISLLILLEPNMAAQIDLSESEKLKISKLNIKQPLLQFVLVLGTQQPELLEKYAQILTSKNRLISLK
mgnify:CR=1 FL=1